MHRRRTAGTAIVWSKSESKKKVHAPRAFFLPCSVLWIITTINNARGTYDTSVPLTGTYILGIWVYHNHLNCLVDGLGWMRECIMCCRRICAGYASTLLCYTPYILECIWLLKLRMEWFCCMLLGLDLVLLFSHWLKPKMLNPWSQDRFQKLEQNIPLGRKYTPGT